MTETAFYILLSLLKPMHGYAIIQHVATITDGRITMGAGTMYGTLKKLEQQHYITLDAEMAHRKIYRITPAGKTQLAAERRRLRELVKNARVLDAS